MTGERCFDSASKDEIQEMFESRDSQNTKNVVKTAENTLDNQQLYDITFQFGYRDRDAENGGNLACKIDSYRFLW